CAVHRANFGRVSSFLISAIQDLAVHLKLCALGQNTHVFAVFHAVDQSTFWPAVRWGPDHSELAVVPLTASILTLLCVRDLRQEEDMPEEVNIDELLDLQSDEERTQKLKDILHTCGNNTEVFITELVNKLHGLQKQEDLHNNGIEHPQLHIFPDHEGSPDTEIN
uniref:Protein phosphatase 1, regulatory (inhibitor) subunit 14Ab n=1 Tax=Cyprinus carpio carpio TaxID=630221 RepID=A0A9J8AY89_CYPCA